MREACAVCTAARQAGPAGPVSSPGTGLLRGGRGGSGALAIILHGESRRGLCGFQTGAGGFHPAEGGEGSTGAGAEPSGTLSPRAGGCGAARLPARPLRPHGLCPRRARLRRPRAAGGETRSLRGELYLSFALLGPSSPAPPHPPTPRGADGRPRPLSREGSGAPSRSRRPARQPSLAGPCAPDADWPPRGAARPPI